jgi:hypothetical protein
MKKFISIFLIGAFMMLFQVVKGQEDLDTTIMYRITTADGNKYFGKIIKQNVIYITLSTEDVGTIQLQREDIKTINAIKESQIRNGKIWYPNLQSTRYFFAPNGYGLKRGEGYYQNVWVLFNQFSVGVVDYFSIGAGTVPLFLFAGTPSPVWVIPKVSIPVIKDKFNIGAGAFLGTVIPEENTGFGIIYGLTTFGSRDRNVSIGVGYGYLSGDWAQNPLINISSFIRISPRTYFITENYFIPSEDNIVIFSLGARSIINRVGLDYGLFIPFFKDQENIFAIPWLGITVPLHKATVDNR